MEAGCLLWGTRVVVPKKLQAQVLVEVHASHPGIVRMKGIARAHVWWPGLSSAIEQTAYNCESCQGDRKQPPSAPLQPWPWPTTPWDRVHIDFAGPFWGYMYLVVVDSHSKWLEVVPMKSTTTEKTLEVLRSLFARYGLPRHDWCLTMGHSLRLESLRSVCVAMESSTSRALPTTLPQMGRLRGLYRLLNGLCEQAGERKELCIRSWLSSC